MVAPATSTAPASAYGGVRQAIAAERCVVLDGGTATELPPRSLANGAQDERLWGTRALVHAPDAVLGVHRAYVEAGCDVITTNTWGLASALTADAPTVWGDGAERVHWMEVARDGVRLARRAIADAGREGECAVAFSLNADVDRPEGAETIRLLARAFAHEPPDLVLLETLALVRESLFETVGGLLGTGLPVWLSFRRCRHGLCGVYGQHWGGPEGDAFGRAARRFEEMGVGALLVNCIPPDHMTGMLPFLRDFTDLPLGAYPNLGYLTDAGWRFDPGVDGAEYAAMALRWREEGAQIVGGCCGVGPEHIAAARERLAGTRPGRVRPAELEPRPRRGEERAAASPAAAEPGAQRARGGSAAKAWTDEHGRSLYPLEFPDLVLEDGVFAPTAGSLLVWRHLFQRRVGAGLRCLDVGCGSGLQAVQLALNGAAHVHAIDVDPAAARITAVNAFRNDVADRVSIATVDLYPWVPQERYDVIVASLYQTPVDPARQVSSHRPLDYWGRNAVDHLLSILPRALAGDGVALVLHLSILSQRRTEELAAEHGLRCRVADWGFFAFTDHFRDSFDQITRVESLSDAYHLTLGDADAMVAYLLEVTLA